MLKLNPVLLRRKVRRTTLIAVGCVSFLVGLGATQLNWRLQATVWLGVVALALMGCWRKVLIVALPVVIVAGGLLGIWRGSVEHSALGVYASLLGTKVTMVGTVASDPSYGAKGQRDFRLQHVQLNGRSPPGEIRITTYSQLNARRGDIVQVKGKLYEGFGNYQAAIYFADASLVREVHGPIEALRRTFAAGLYSALPATEASLGIGILIGIKTDLPDDLNAQLKALSLTHIIVASGYNLTILVRVARRLFERRSKYQTALAASMLMAGFVAVTGFSPSMSRATLVSGLSLAAWYYGRRIHPMVLLVLSAAITAGLDPLSLWSDIGWWLSFLAFAGVLIVAPLLQKRIFGAKQPKLIGQIVLETVAAQLLTVPLMVAIFGSPSLLALPANVLIVPLVPLIMLLTGIGGIAGLLLPVAAAYIALPAGWLLSYVIHIVALLAGASWATIQLTISPGVMLAAYAAIGVICVALWRKTKHDFMGKSVIE
jgi:competence protein ComEC